MCEYLDNFDFSTVNAATTRSVIDSVTNFLKRAESHLASTVTQSPPPSPSSFDSSSAADILQTADTPVPQTEDASSTPIALLVDHFDRCLETPLLNILRKDLSTFNYTPTGKNCPGVCLFGDRKYVYNKATKDVEPIPITDFSVISSVLDTVNFKMGKMFNSVLINRYHTRKTFLDWHQDDEPEVDSSFPIATLSIGASRRFMICDNKIKAERKQYYEKELHDNSLLVMKSGLQNTHHHKLADGRSSIECERGVRYSLTFRRLISSSNAVLPSATLTPSPAPVSTEEQNTVPNQKKEHGTCYQSFVFGSSLTGGLDEEIMSKGKRFKVFSKPGAHVRDIIKTMRDAFNDKEVCLDCVDSVFVVCGGNDAENIRSEMGMRNLENSFRNLFKLISHLVPKARINIMSLIPRRVHDYWHLQHIFGINEFLEYECPMYSNCFFIKVFTNFLAHKERYYSNKEVHLNNKLFRKDRLHFNSVGDSVLAKVLMGVANSPRNR